MYEKARLVGDAEIIGLSSTGVMMISKLASAGSQLLTVSLIVSFLSLSLRGLIVATQFGAVPPMLTPTLFPVVRLT